jgi:ubiquitin carboxyl-terminal hydrolase 4/11/15
MLLLSNSCFQPPQAFEEDEGIELEDTSSSAQAFSSLSTWSFENIPSIPEEESPFDSGAASDEAQHDSSGDERALSPQDDIDSNFPGMSEYKLPQPGVDLPSYLDQQASDFPVRPSNGDAKYEVHEVIPDGEHSPQSDEAAEIHLDDDDKIKV